MRDAIFEESVYYRVLQFEKGEIQFTDACYPAVPDSLGVLLSQNSTH